MSATLRRIETVANQLHYSTLANKVFIHHIIILTIIFNYCYFMKIHYFLLLSLYCIWFFSLSFLFHFFLHFFIWFSLLFFVFSSSSLSFSFSYFKNCDLFLLYLSFSFFSLKITFYKRMIMTWLLLEEESTGPRRPMRWPRGIKKYYY